jgi:hypothetical protein
MAKTVCKILGFVFLLVGILGFTHLLDPLGAHLTPAHNVVHLVSGAIALYFGFPGPLSGAKVFCLIFGIVYLALGILGLVIGGVHTWHVIDNVLMFGRRDDAIHILLGAVFLGGGLFTKSS